MPVRMQTLLGRHINQSLLGTTTLCKIKHYRLDLILYWERPVWVRGILGVSSKRRALCVCWSIPSQMITSSTSSRVEHVTSIHSLAMLKGNALVLLMQKLFSLLEILNISKCIVRNASYRRLYQIQATSGIRLRIRLFTISSLSVSGRDGHFWTCSSHQFRCDVLRASL